MALKKLVQIDESFPVLKRARLGAAPPAEDVLDNVGAVDVQPPPLAIVEVPKAATEEESQTKMPKKRDRSARRVGQGVHKGAGTDARRYRKTGRTDQFGARVKPEFAETVKVMAADKNMTIGELLEEMLNVYKAAK